MNTNRYSLRSVFSLLSCDLAIDLGTTNTLVFSKGKGIVVNEPAIVALNRNSGEMVAAGNLAAIKPMKGVVIADFNAAEKMLTYFIQKAHKRRVLVLARIVIRVPSEITPVSAGSRAARKNRQRPTD